MTRRSFALCLLLAGCGAEKTQTIDLSDAGSGIAFAMLGSDGEPWSVAGGPFGLEEGQLTFGARPQLGLDPGQVVVVVVVPNEALELEGYDPGWVTQVHLQIGGHIETTLLTDGRLSTYVPLPLDSQFFGPGSGDAPAVEAELRGSLGLRIPVDPEHCRPATEPSLSAWGVPGGPLQAIRGMGLDLDLRNVAGVDADHLVAHSYGSLFALTRGVAIRAEDVVGGSPRRVVTLQSALPAAGLASIRDVAVDPRPGPVRAVVAVVTDVSLRRAHLLMAEYTQQGLQQVRTATTIEESALRGVDFASDGSWLATGDEGLVLMGHGDSPSVRRGPRAVPRGVGLRSVVATKDPEQPWVMTGNKVVNLFDAGQPGWRSEAVGVDLGGDILFDGLATTGSQDSLQVWAGGRSGLLFARRADASWTHLMLEMPPRFGACTQQLDVARPFLPLEIKDLEIADGYVYAAVHSCNAIVQVRLSDHCTSLAPLGADHVRGEGEPAVGVDVIDGHIVVVGAEGRIWDKRTR